MADYKAVVDAGVAWLDTNRPNWRAKVDKDSLRMQSVFDCMLGQTGGYDNALAEAVPSRDSDEWHPDRERDDWADAHGFRVPSAVVDNGGWDALDEAYAALHAEWLTKL